jgi:hypothetical protein
VGALRTAQTVAIETVDIAALKTSQVVAISTANVAALTTAQVVALTTAQVASLTSAQLGALTTAQAVAIETADIAALKTSQISALSTTNVAALTTTQIQAITTADIAALTSAQAVALRTSQIVALTTAQVAALTTTNLNALGTSQIVAFETTDIAALKTSQVIALSTANLVALTTSQIGAFTSSQAGALTTGQVESLTTAQIGAFSVSNGATGALKLGSPIVLDLDGNGVSTRSIAEGTTFDLFATGKEVQTGWVSSGDGLLVLDRSGDGSINDGTELFGTATRLRDGSNAADGYAALRELDDNGDGVIDANDAAFTELKVWVDANSDGNTDGGELKSLQSLGIASISAQADVELIKDNGNLIGLTSTYQTEDGVTHEAADVWFVADANQAPPVLTDVVQVCPVLTDVVTVCPPPPAPVASDLRSQVSTMAQALTSYAAADPSGGGATALSQSGAAPSPVAIAVSGMVNAMQQFDANGNLQKPAAPAVPPLNGTQGAAAQLKPAQQDLLASASGLKPPGV